MRRGRSYKRSVARDPELRKEAEATLAARRELGQELEPELVDAFVERVERRLDERLSKARPAPRDRRQEFVITLVSLGVAVPMLGIAGGTAGLPGVVAVCAALVLVNLLVRR